MRISAFPSATPLRTFILTFFLLLTAVVRPALCGFEGDDIRLIGTYSNVAVSTAGRPHGFEVSLWRDRGDVIGLITYVDAEEAYSHTSLIRHITLVEETGAITLRARMSLAERRHASGDWGRAIESIEFTGTLEDVALVGRFAADREPDAQTYFKDQDVTLHRQVTPESATYRSYSRWLSAQEHRIGTREIAVALEEPASREGRSMHVGLSGGILRTGGDDARFFNTGGGHFSIDAFYTVASRYSLGARVGFSRFESNVLAVGDDVTPLNVRDASIKAPESGFLFELAPTFRVWSSNPVSERVAGFLQVSGGYYYVNLETPYSLAWTEGAHLQVKNGSVGHVGHHLGASASIGMSIKASEFSRIEIAPEYHRTFGDSDLSLFGVMIHFRVDFLHG